MNESDGILNHKDVVLLIRRGLTPKKLLFAYRYNKIFKICSEFGVLRTTVKQLGERWDIGRRAGQH